MFTLSLLSRGNGQVVQSKQKRLEVFLEPEDYLNWTPQDKALIGKPQNREQVTWGSLPKTYSTRKGVLILYSEDFAEPSWKQEERKKGPHSYHRQKKKSGVVLHTLKDLTAAILAYGSERKDQKYWGWQPYLRSLSKPDSQNEQQIRPGYSAKRYLFSLFQNWTSGTLYKLQCSGYIRDPRLFQDNQLYLPNHLRRQQDLSAVPSKYHLLPVYPSVSPFWTQKEQLADEDTSDLDNEESEDSDVEKEDSRAEKHWEKKVPLPPLRQKPPGRATWLKNEAYAEDTWMEPHQGIQALKKSQGHHGKSHPPLGSGSLFDDIETPRFLSQRSHSTFYGGTFPDRKTYLRNVKISKSRHQMFPELLIERCVLPPVQPTISPEQNVPRKVKKKKMPKALKLPAITEEPPKAQDPLRSQRNDYGSPEELLILPLEVHLCAVHQPKERGQRGGNDFSHPHSSTHEMRDSERKSSKIQQKTVGARSSKDFMDDGTSQSGLPEELIGSSQDPALGNILMGPAGDIVCQPLLGSVQSIDLPLQLDFASGQAYQFVDSSTNVGEACSNDQHVRKGNIHSEASLHMNTCETSSLTPEPEKKGAPQSLEAAVLKTGESQSFINKELENEEGQESQGRQASTITENHQQDPALLGNGRSEQKVRIQTEEPCPDSDVFPEHQRPTRDGCAPLSLEPPAGSLSVLETEKPKPQVDGSSTKEVEKQRDGNSGSHGTSWLKQNLTPWAETIKELDGNNELSHHLTRPLGNAPVAPKMGGAKRNPTEKQPPSRSRKGKDVPPKLGKLAEESISPERQMPEKTKRRKRNEVNKSKAPSHVGKGEKPQNKTEFAGGKPKKQKTENKTKSVSKKKKPRAKKKEMGQKGRTLEIGSELSNSSSTEDESDEDCSLSSYNSQELTLPPKYQTPESQVSRDERLYPIQPIIAKENTDSEKDKSADTSEALPADQQQEKVPRERILAERAEMRLQQVEKRRREKEERKRQQQEEHRRLEQLKEELEQEQQRRAEEKRLQKQKLEEERRQQAEEERRKLQQEQAAQARARQQQEEFRRKMQEMQRKKQEEDARRAEAEKQRQKELERQLEEEEKRLMEMAKEERLEYQRRKEEEEKKARQDAEAKRQKKQEEARLALEEAKKIAAQLEREKAAMKAHQHFNQQLLKEANELKHIQSISRPWVYSYFQLLQISGSEAVIEEK
ncbi:uncharacterized protein KIAA2012 homolog [Vombatus ursinus]|uniref:uncharacterized protein KIAA2012 homolog n=1 Tax=Vombatus ursinus TaxID=29139 RepID=UPI000FFD0712|nr:uncharacterized protein KIAA2012 homolog [Vombatus ursinus]